MNLVKLVVATVVVGIVLNVLMLVGFPYSLSWWWIGTGIVIGVIAGAVTGALYKK